jgi:hypothetical protein
MIEQEWVCIGHGSINCCAMGASQILLKHLL